MYITSLHSEEPWYTKKRNDWNELETGEETHKVRRKQRRKKAFSAEKLEIFRQTMKVSKTGYFLIIYFSWTSQLFSHYNVNILLFCELWLPDIPLKHSAADEDSVI